VIRRGENYGWPEVSGLRPHPRFIEPLVEWTPAIAPAGLAIYTGDEFPWGGNIFVAALRGTHLRRVVVERTGAAAAPAAGAAAPQRQAAAASNPADAGEYAEVFGWRVTHEEALVHEEVGRIRGVVMGPDGRLYFTNSNRDGRGSPAANDDRVFRIVPR
jgi:glucose/arabinose dehydrogenase